jgi:hypothetical protein
MVNRWRKPQQAAQVRRVPDDAVEPDAVGNAHGAAALEVPEAVGALLLGRDASIAYKRVQRHPVRTVNHCLALGGHPQRCEPLEIAASAELRADQRTDSVPADSLELRKAPLWRR